MVILMTAKNVKDITNEQQVSMKIGGVILTIRKETLFLENN